LGTYLFFPRAKALLEHAINLPDRRVAAELDAIKGIAFSAHVRHSTKQCCIGRSPA